MSEAIATPQGSAQSTGSGDSQGTGVGPQGDGNSRQTQGKANEGSTSKVAGAQSGAGPAGASVTGKPDAADKASQANQQGIELSEEQLNIPVTRLINGQKVTKPIKDWIGANQLEQASYERFQKAQQIERDAAQKLELFKRNPAKFMADNGIDPFEFSQATLAQRLEYLGMTEEQRELYQLRFEKQQRDEADKQQKLQDQQRVQQEQDEKEYQSMAKEFLEAWKSSGLPDHPYFGQLTAATMARARTQGIPLTWEKAAAIVKRDFSNTHQNVLASFPTVEALAEYLGEPVLKKLRDYEVARVSAKNSRSKSSPKRPGGEPASQKAKKQSFVNERDYHDYWERKKAEFSS